MTAHPFSHLGPVPYRFLGAETTDDRRARNTQRAAAGHSFTTNLCGGSCDHCGTAINNIFRFEAADGARFKVGSTCCEKARKEYPAYDRALEAASKARRETAKAIRHTREAAKLEDANAWIGNHAADLSALPHPKPWAAKKGETLLDSLRWFWSNAGTAGKLKSYRGAVKALTTS